MYMYTYVHVYCMDVESHRPLAMHSTIAIHSYMFQYIES